jgi:peptidyl-prolyl cis-trans isomerase D
VSKLTQFFGAVIVILIALVFILQFQPAAQTKLVAAGGTSCAIEIEGDCISKAHWTAEYRLLVRRLAPGADADRLRGLGLYRRTTDGLIERWLLNKDAKRLGLTVSDDDLTASLGSGRAYASLPAQEGLPTALIIPLAVENRQTKKFDSKAYEREVRVLTQLSPPEFREFQRQEILAERMRDLIRSRAHVSEAEAFNFYTREKSTAVVGYIKLDARFYADMVADTSQKAIDAWAEKNKELVDKTWETRKSSYLPECRVTREIYVDHEGTDEAKAEAKKKIDEAIARVKGGESFADVARSVSEAEESKASGGELGCVGKGGTLPKPVEEAIFALEKDKVSDAIETDGGYFAVKVEAIAKDAEAEKIGQRLVTRELYLKHEGDRLAAEAAKQIHAAVRGGKTLDDALKAHMDEIAASKQAGSKDKKKGDKKEAGKKADAKKDGDKAGVEKTDAEKADAEKKDAAAAGVVTLETHPSRPIVEASLPFNAGGSPITGVAPGQDVAKAAFQLEKAGDLLGDVVPLERGYAVIQLKEKTPIAKEQWEKDRDGYVTSMRTRKELDALINYMKKLRQASEKEIKVTPEFATEPKPTKDGETAPMEDPLGME